MVLFRIEQAAELLAVSTDTIQALAESGYVPTVLDSAGQPALDGSTLTWLAERMAAEGLSLPAPYCPPPTVGGTASDQALPGGRGVRPGARRSFSHAGLHAGSRLQEVLQVIIFTLRHRSVARVLFRGERAPALAAALRFRLASAAGQLAGTEVAVSASSQPPDRAGPPQLVVDVHGGEPEPEGAGPARPAAAAASGTTTGGALPGGAAAGGAAAGGAATGRAAEPADGAAEPAEGADIVIDCRDPNWPIVADVRAGTTYPDHYRLREVRAYFAVRAAAWDARFAGDVPAYARAVADSGLRAGAVVADVGCGTGPALPALWTAVGAGGAVLGVDVTPQMLRAARSGGRGRGVALLLGDALRLPLADRCLDAVFAGALLPHLPDPARGLAELARVTRRRGRLVLFHPSGRSDIADRHGGPAGLVGQLARRPLQALLRGAGWRLSRYDDDGRFFVLAERGLGWRG